jgi:hypothetical protein
MTQEGDRKRFCIGCKTYQPLDSFLKRNSPPKRKGQYYGRCKPCRHEQYKVRYGSLETYFGNKLARIKRRDKIEVSITVDDVMSMWRVQGGKCALTGRKMTVGAGSGSTGHEPSIDRIDSSGGYSIENVWLVTSSANYAKHKLSMGEFLKLCQKVIEKHGQK